MSRYSIPLKPDIPYSDHVYKDSWTGDIPEEIFNKKYEQTDMYEDPDAVRNFQRSALKDMGPDDSNTFASDAPYRNVGRISGVLNSREHGSRYSKVPRHSEIFTELTGADPRGTSNMPNMSLMNEISRRKADDYRLSFKNDEDNSVSESNRNIFRVSRDIKDANERAKQQLQIFDESETTWGVRSSIFHSNKSNKNKVLMDGNTLDISDSDQAQRRSAVTEISNDINMGWASVGSQKAKISKYQRVYSGNGKAYDGRYNRDMAETDMKIMKTREGYIPQSVVKLMNKFVRSRALYQETLPASNRYWGKPPEHIMSNRTVKEQQTLSRMLEARQSMTGKRAGMRSETVAGLRKTAAPMTDVRAGLDQARLSAKITGVAKRQIEMRASSNMASPDDLRKARDQVQAAHKKKREIVNGHKSGLVETFTGTTKNQFQVQTKFGKARTVHNYKLAPENPNTSRLGQSSAEHEMGELHDDEIATRALAEATDPILARRDGVQDVGFLESYNRDKHAVTHQSSGGGRKSGYLGRDARASADHEDGTFEAIATTKTRARK